MRIDIISVLPKLRNIILPPCAADIRVNTDGSPYLRDDDGEVISDSLWLSEGG